MTSGPAFDERVKSFAEKTLASLTPERRAELEMFADVEPGMRLRPAVRYPEWVELIYGGEVIGLTSWAWLNDGVSTPPSDGPAGYNHE